MPIVTPLAEADAVDRVAQTYGRLKEALGVEALPEIMLSFGRVEPFLRDFYMNFKKFVLSDGALDIKTKSAIALAAACQQKSTAWIEFLSQRAVTSGFSEEQVAEIVAVVGTCAMYNSFYKFLDLSGSDKFGAMGIGLRAHTFTGTSLEEQLVELVNIAVSDLNGCKPCTTGHLDAAKKMGLTDEQLLETIQCASTVVSACQFSAAT